MPHVRKAIILVLAGVLLAAALCGPALARHEGACYEGGARHDARSARRALVRATVRYREAKHILSATRYYSHHDYSDFADRYVDPVPVGRWVRLARRCGWGWGQIDMLMHVIARESSGCPTVLNGEGSGACGLLQLMPGWYRGEWTIGGQGRTFDPTDPYLNLYWGERIWEENGWSPWLV